MNYEDTTSSVLYELGLALDRIDPEETEKYIELLLSSEKVFFVGVGRVELALAAAAKRFFHIGIRTCCVGDITEPAIGPNDLLVVGSGSGESIVPAVISQKAKALGATVLHIGSNTGGVLSSYADYTVRIPVRTKLYLADEINSAQPMTSLFEQCLLLYNDIVAKMIIDRNGTDLEGLWKNHANLE